VFFGQGDCARCHRLPMYTDVNTGSNPPTLHDASEIGATSGYEQRSATKQFRTTPLRGVWQHPPYFHDGRAATLLDVVNHYNTHFPSLRLSEPQKLDLVQFLKSL
jgi:cytochrome c peroxidase